MNNEKLIERYLSYLSDCGVTHGSIKTYRSDLRAFSSWVVGSILKVNHDDAMEYMRSLEDLAASSRRKRHISIKAFYKWAMDDGLVDQNPMDRVRRPKKPKRFPKPSPVDDLLRLLNYIRSFSERDFLLFYFCLCTGLRISEALSIKVEDLPKDPSKDLMEVIGKGDKQRLVPLTLRPKGLESLPVLHEALSGFVQDVGQGYIFKAQGRSRLSYRRAKELWDHYCKSLGAPFWVPSGGVRYQIHDLRHTYATGLLDSGASLEFVSTVLGHSDIKTTLGYAAVTGRRILSEAQRLEAYQRASNI